jgi:arsenate reductase-like glutaredoxin family protein
MFKKISIVILAMILAVIMFEFFLRYSPFTLGAVPIKYDKEMGIWHKNNFSSRWLQGCYDTEYFFDAKGFVKNAYIYKKNRKDIILLGDSYIEALMVENENIIHNSLYKLYKGKYNFLNHAMAATSPVQQLVILQKKTNLKNVKKVIHFINMDKDIYEGDSIGYDKSSMNPTIFLEFSDLENYKIIYPRDSTKKDEIKMSLSNFEIYSLLTKFKVYIKNKRIEQRENSSQENKKVEDLSHNWLQIKGAIYQTKKLLKKRDIEYTIIVYGENEVLKDELKSFLTKQKIDFYELYLLMNRYNLPVEVYSCDKHWNDKTHKNIAKAIREQNII